MNIVTGNERFVTVDISKYFEVVSAKEQVLHIRLKGFWTDEVMAQIEEQFALLFEQGVDSMGGKKFFVVADMADFKPPSQLVKEAIGRRMKYAREHNLAKTVEVMPSALTRMAIKQAAQVSGKDDFRIVVDSVEEAWKKINELKKA